MISKFIEIETQRFGRILLNVEHIIFVQEYKEVGAASSHKYSALIHLSDKTGVVVANTVQEVKELVNS